MKDKPIVSLTHVGYTKDPKTFKSAYYLAKWLFHQDWSKKSIYYLMTKRKIFGWRIVDEDT